MRGLQQRRAEDYPVLRARSVLECASPLALLERLGAFSVRTDNARSKITIFPTPSPPARSEIRLKWYVVIRRHLLHGIRSCVNFLGDFRHVWLCVGNGDIVLYTWVHERCLR